MSTPIISFQEVKFSSVVIYGISSQFRISLQILFHCILFRELIKLMSKWVQNIIYFHYYHPNRIKLVIILILMKSNKYLLAFSCTFYFLYHQTKASTADWACTLGCFPSPQAQQHLIYSVVKIDWQSELLLVFNSQPHLFSQSLPNSKGFVGVFFPSFSL